MNMVYASTYLYLLQFLSSMSYNFSSTRFLHPWLGLLLGILFFLKHLWMGFVFLIWLSVSSLLAYKSPTDFWILILYPATLLNSLFSSSSFFMESLGFSKYRVMSSANNDSFTTSFLIWMPFISSSCLTAVARTSSTMLNKRGQSGHPCLAPYRKESRFWVLNMILAVGLSYMAFIMLRYVPSWL